MPVVTPLEWLARLVVDEEQANSSAIGWFLIAACVGSGIVDSILIRLSAPKHALSPADAARLRARETDALFHQAIFGLLLGMPGAILGPLGARRRNQVDRGNPNRPWLRRRPTGR